MGIILSIMGYFLSAAQIKSVLGKKLSTTGTYQVYILIYEELYMLAVPLNVPYQFVTLTSYDIMQCSDQSTIIVI